MRIKSKFRVLIGLYQSRLKVKLRESESNTETRSKSFLKTPSSSLSLNEPRNLVYDLMTETDPSSWVKVSWVDPNAKRGMAYLPRM